MASDADNELSETMFSRTNRSGEPMGELRVNLATKKLSVLDSVAISETKSSGRFISRTDLVDRIISEWVANKVEEANLVYQAIKENPTLLEGDSK